MEELTTRFVMEMGLDKLATLDNVLNQLKNPEDLFRIIWDSEVAHQIFVPPVTYSKSVTDAEAARIEGNTLYKSGRFMEALGIYNMSIMLSPHPELEYFAGPDGMDPDSADLWCKPRCSAEELKKYKTLGLTYANRSAAFLSLNEYDSCITDIDLAIKYGYPQEMKSKLEERRERCLMAKEKKGGIGDKPSFVSLNSKTPPTLKEVNPMVPSFSSALEVTFSDSKGRHIVASRDILPGEVIAVERSYCSDVHCSRKIGKNCPVCLLETLVRIPCPSCPLIAYCSEKCRAKGSSEHMKSCMTFYVMEALDLEEDQFARLAVKVATSTTFAVLQETETVLSQESKQLHPRKLGFDGEGKFNSDYRSVYHMVTSRQTLKRHELVREFCLKAFLITKILHQSRNFFVNKDGLIFRPTREDFILTGTVLLRFMLYAFHIFCISDIKVGPVDAEQTKEVIANGLYPALSLMRNSCNAPTVFYNFGHVKIARAISPIAAGQEVTMSFVMRFVAMDFLLRSAILMKSGISCSCEACVGGWPPLPFVPKDIVFSCLQCSQGVNQNTNWVCSSCGTDYSKKGKKSKNNSLSRRWWSMVDQVKQGFGDFELICKKFEAGQMVTTKDYKRVCDFASLIGKNLKEPSLIFTKVRDIFIMFFYREM